MAFMRQLDAYEAVFGIPPNKRSPAYLALAYARERGIKGIPADDGWSEWTPRQMKRTTQWLRSFLRSPRAKDVMRSHDWIDPDEIQQGHGWDVCSHPCAEKLYAMLCSDGGRPPELAEAQVLLFGERRDGTWRVGVCVDEEAAAIIWPDLRPAGFTCVICGFEMPPERLPPGELADPMVHRPYD